MKGKGFTLVELLAVIVILAIVLAIAVPSITGLIHRATIDAFSSDAKMVLKAIDYKLLETSNYNIEGIDRDKIKIDLELGNNNYESVSVSMKDNQPYIIIVGQNKWDDLVACGTYTNMIVGDGSECDGELPIPGEDTTPPVITLLGSDLIIIYEGDTYDEEGATAVDDMDGNITNEIIVNSGVNTTVPGEYTITYNVSDSAGNPAIEVIREVIVLSIYNAEKGVNRPKLAKGMIPVKWNETTLVETYELDSEWYEYGTTLTTRRWANAVSKDTSGNIIAYWVWIPRYAYNITSGWNNNITGNISISFSVGIDDTKGGTIAIVDTCDEVNSECAKDSNGTWTNHPSFTFGEDELTGIWVTKFEVSGNVDEIDSKPNVRHLGDTKIGDMFTAFLDMKTNNRYGWGTTGNGIDTHMMKNTEWGAVAYLSQSTYGKNNFIWKNPSIDRVGCAGDDPFTHYDSGCSFQYYTDNGQQASTTGSIYGIYDMVGSNFNYVAAYVDNGFDEIMENGASIVAANDKYKDVYPSELSYSKATNFNNAIIKKGDAIYEISSTGEDYTSWYESQSSMGYNSWVWFIRGGSSWAESGISIFSYGATYGNGSANTGFHGVLAVDSKL